jgi:hypothetical protein
MALPTPEGRLIAEQKSDVTQYNEEIGSVVLQRTRSTAQGLGIEYIDQLMPRLVEERYGPVLIKRPNRRGSTNLPIWCSEPT